MIVDAEGTQANVEEMKLPHRTTGLCLVLLVRKHVLNASLNTSLAFLCEEINTGQFVSGWTETVWECYVLSND